MEKLLTQKEVADILCISTRTLYNWRKAGKAPFLLEINGYFHARPSDLDEFITRARWGA